jgi:hypothetical protein
MRIDIEGDRDSRVAEALANDLRVNPSLECHGCVSMSQIMEPDSAYPCQLDAVCERMREASGMDRAAVGLRENQSARVLELVTPSQPLDFEMVAQHRNRPIVERYNTTTSVALRAPDRDDVASFYNRLQYSQLSVFQIDIGPSDTEDFATAHPG